MEASTLQAPTTLAKPRVSAAAPFLRLRSDEQLVALFRAGHDDAFRAIHDRYHKRLMAYARQMLPGRQDAEDALQDVFVRAYSGLRANDRDLALRAWLFRVAHNRCIDELRRPAPPPPEVLHLVRPTVQDPVAEVDLRESLRRLIADVRRLPDQQRSALLLRELGGLSYVELATSLGISVGAVKSVLVRARIALAQAAEARDTACSEIREELVGSYDHGVRPNANARRHMRDCAGCRDFRHELRGTGRQLAALAPTVGPLGFLAQLLGISGGAGGGAGATAGGATAGGATAGGAAIATGGGATASAGAALGAGHVATLIAAAVATAGGAVAIQHTIAPAHRHHARAHFAGTQSTHHAAPARRIGAPADASANGYAPSAAAASAAAVAQKARAAALAHHKANIHQSSLPGTGGSSMIGSLGKNGPVKTAAGVGAGTTVTGAAKRKGSSGTASATGAAGGSCAAATGASNGTGTSSSTGTASQATTGTAPGTAATGTGSGSGTSASTGTASTTGTGTATGASSSPCSTPESGSSSTSTGSGTGTPATGSGASGSSSASTSPASATSPSSSSSTPAWY